MFTKADYDVGTAALLHLIQVNVQKLPFFERGMIPADKEPLAAASGAKCVLDAVAAHQPTPAKEPAK